MQIIKPGVKDENINMASNVDDKLNLKQVTTSQEDALYDVLMCVDVNVFL